MDIAELFENLGVAEDKTEDAKKALNRFLDGNYMPKSRFNEVNEAKKTLTITLAERENQLEELKAAKGAADSLKERIKELQAENMKAMEKAEAEMKELRLNSAIKIAIADKAQDVDLVAGLFDRSKLILGEDGKVTGLEEQLKNLQENKAFLFKGEVKTPSYKPNGGENKKANPFARETFNLTEQGRMLRENPEEARALAAAAGVKI